MRAHPAGPLHADLLSEPGPSSPPGDVNALGDGLWPAATARSDAGELTLHGRPVTDLAGTFGSPVLLLDEADFRRRAREFHDVFGANVNYAGKAFLTTDVARWVAECGLGLDVATGGELSVALRAGFPPDRLLMHGNNKSVGELRKALEVGVGRIVVDSFEEIDRLTALAREHGVRPACWCE